MYKFIVGFSFCCAIGFVSCQNNKAPAKAIDRLSDTTNFTTIQWADTAKDFGSVVKGAKPKIIYTCTNTGNKPLFIAYVRPSCGCTVADYTKDAIMPGKEGTITAEFDSNHGTGEIHKSIEVAVNAKNRPAIYLTFTGNVLDK
ncbi:MAG: DUF1573 domain-containing protein [Chitinophagaceae bacterium]|jgi:hypothetical protein|nr:DUF1573 domain-containing protein [Chitinophagaceae bacterium]